MFHTKKKTDIINKFLMEPLKFLMITIWPFAC